MDQSAVRWRRMAARGLAAELDHATGQGSFPLEPASDLASTLELLVPELLRAGSEVWDGESLDGLLEGRITVTSPLAGQIVAVAVVMSNQAITPVEIDYSLTGTRDDFTGLEVRLGESAPGEPAGIRHHRLHPSQAVNLLHDHLHRRAPVDWAYVGSVRPQ